MESCEDACFATARSCLAHNVIAGTPNLAVLSSGPRLNPVSGVASHKDDPRVIASRERIKRFGLAAAMNLQTLLTERSRT
jgi:hypothetical protein